MLFLFTCIVMHLVYFYFEKHKKFAGEGLCVKKRFGKATGEGLDKQHKN